MFGRIHFDFTSASIVAIIGAAAAVAVSFGVHLSQQNIDSIMTLVGLLGAAITIGGATKSAGLIRAGLTATPVRLHFTSATIISIAAAGIAVAVSFGLHLSQTDIGAIMKLVGLLAAGFAVGGGIKSQAALRAGVHPLQLDHPAARHRAARPRGPHPH